MPLTVGTRIGAYEIGAPIGEGGMGVVYRATDTHLGRPAAVKVLPEAFAADTERIARFEREARTLASLNHPNIALVYGLEKGTSGLALVMELVEGPTLADRLATGRLALDEALPIARQITEALEAAHDAGIVHRDLKPANVKVREDGTVKVLDFGLAKAIESGVGNRASGAGKTPVTPPTITTPAMTAAGMIIGTAAYMSPEQARGRPVDRRADIWAFGCVLYEMLTGRRAFAGDDISDVLVAVLRDEPDLSALPPDAPRHVRTLLRRCLQKDPRNRLPHIGAARLELSETTEPQSAVSTADRAPARSRLAERVLWAMLGGAMAGAVAFVLRPAATVEEPRQAVTFDITPPPGTSFPGAAGAPRFAVSPDGSSVAYQARVGAGNALFVRRLDVAEPRMIAGTESLNDTANQSVFWSPDGQALAYFDEPARQLRRVDLQTGAISTLCDVPGNQVGGAWNAEGVILASSVATGGVWRVSSSGGAPTLLTKVDEARQERAHLYPQFLPDGRHFIYLARAASPALYVASLDGDKPVKLLDTEHAAHFAAPETLLYVRGDALVAQKLDLDRLAMAGEPSPVVSAILRTAAGRVAVSAAATGVLVYARGDAEDLREGRWLDRSGRRLDLPPVPGAGTALRLSQNGRLVSLLRPTRGLGPDLWVYDVEREVPARIAPLTDSLFAGVFSPDGSRVAYRRDEGSGSALLVQPISGATEVLVALRANREDSLAPNDWTPDGQAIVFSRTVSGERGLYSLTLAGPRTPVPYLVGGPNRSQAAVSPDGQWVAYTSDEGGAPQVFVQSFPDPTRGRFTVSRPGGMFPRWRRDGRELYFADPGGRFYAVEVTPGSSIQIGQPVLLFETQVTAVAMGAGQPYDVTPDGQRFLVLQQRLDAPVPITVVVNWDQQIAR